MGSYIYFISVSKDIASSRLNKHKVDAKHIKKKKADGDKEGENNEVEAVAE